MYGSEERLIVAAKTLLSYDGDFENGNQYRDKVRFERLDSLNEKSMHGMVSGSKKIRELLLRLLIGFLKALSIKEQKDLYLRHRSRQSKLIG